MTGPLRIRLDAEQGGHVEAVVWSRAHPGGLAVFDHNWLFAELVARTAPPRFKCHAFLRTGDFVRFAAALAELRDGGRDTARFAPHDPWLWIAVERNGGGYVAQLRLRDGGSERAVACTATLRQAELEQFTAAVTAVADRFPVVARGSSIP